jgi:hypothetical protein
MEAQGTEEEAAIVLGVRLANLLESNYPILNGV